MLDVQEIKNQNSLDCEEMSRDQACEIAQAERWSAHVEDGLDAFAREIHKAETEKWLRVLAEARSNPKFRQQLSEDPVEAVKPFGISVPAKIRIKLVEDTDSVRHLVLPAQGTDGASGLAAAEAENFASSIAHATSTAQLPQTWADTWQPDMPVPDPGRPA